MADKPQQETLGATVRGETPDRVARFEAALKELEDIVQRMERGDLPLEQSLQMFERGVVLTRECREALDTAELRIKQLMGSSVDPRQARDDVS